LKTLFIDKIKKTLFNLIKSFIFIKVPSQKSFGSLVFPVIYKSLIYNHI
jgi:hypothetical protein